MAKPGTSVEREAETEKVTETMTERRPYVSSREGCLVTESDRNAANDLDGERTLGANPS